jgi:hypothetical protein
VDISARKPAPIQQPFAFGRMPPPDEPQVQRSYFPEQARPAPRATAAAYAIAAAVPEADEPQQGKGLPIPDRAPAAQRAQPDAYFVTAKVPEADFAQIAPFTANNEIPRPAVRSPANAYDIFSTFVGQELLGGMGHQDQQPRQPPRASQLAYSIQSTFVNLDLLWNFGHQTLTAPAAPRASNMAYWLMPRWPLDLPIDVPPTQGQQDWTPRQPPRAGVHTYWIEPPARSAEESLPSQYGVQDWTPRPWPRSAVSSYWIEPRARSAEESRPSAFGDQDWFPKQPPRAARHAYWIEPPARSAEESLPVALGWQTVLTPSAPRAGPTAYWIDHKAGIEGPDAPAGKGSQTEFARLPARANQEAYALIQRPVREEPAEGGGYIEPISRAMQRASSAVYWIDPRVGDLFASMPPAMGWITHSAPGPARAQSDAYQIFASFAYIEVPPAKGLGLTDVFSRFTARSAPSTYWLEQHPYVEPLILAFGHQTASATGAQRPSPAAYWIEPRLVNLDPGRPVAFGWQTERADANRRPSSPAYWIEPKLINLDFGLPAQFGFQTHLATAVGRAENLAYAITIAVPPIELPAARGFQEDASRLPRRSVPLAYWIEPRALWLLEFGIPAAFGYQTHSAPAPNRAAPSAYWTYSAFQIADPPSPGAVLLPQLAPASSRAANDAYWRQMWFEIADPMPMGRGWQTERAATAARSAVEAYSAKQPTILPLGEEWIRGPVMPAEARPAQRAAISVYWLDQRARITEESFPAAFGWQTQSAPVAARAANDAYWKQTPPATQDPSAFGFIGQPLAFARAGNQAFWIGIPVPVANIPLAFGYQDWVPRAALRSAWSAHWIEPRVIPLSLGIPAAFGFQENRPMVMPRTSRWAYDILSAFVVPDAVLVGLRFMVYGCDGSVGQVHGNSVERIPIYGEND